MFSSYDTLLLLLHLTRNLDTGDVGADTNVGGVSDMSVSSHGDSVSETSGSRQQQRGARKGQLRRRNRRRARPQPPSCRRHKDDIRNIRQHRGGYQRGTRKGKLRQIRSIRSRARPQPPSCIDIGMISGVSYHTMVDNGSDSGVSNDSNIVCSSLGNSVSNVMSGSDLSDSVRLRLSLSLPLSVEMGISNHRGVDSSVREASYSSNSWIADTSDNTTSSAASQHLSDGVGIRLAADGYSKEHCEEGTHGECRGEW